MTLILRSFKDRKPIKIKNAQTKFGNDLKSTKNLVAKVDNILPKLPSIKYSLCLHKTISRYINTPLANKPLSFKML